MNETGFNNVSFLQNLTLDYSEDAVDGELNINDISNVLAYSIISFGKYIYLSVHPTVSETCQIIINTSKQFKCQAKLKCKSN